MWEVMNLADQIRDEFIEENIWKELDVLIEQCKGESCVRPNDDNQIKWKWWTQNYIEADQSNFEIITWKIWRNEIVKWKLKK